MTATQAPTPGPLSAEDVKLLRKGDLLLALETTCNFFAGEVLTFEGPGPLSECMVNGMSWMASRFAFIGRPDADGWMPWSGGENPIGKYDVVEIKRRDGTRVIDAAHKFDWLHSPRRSDPSDIIAFRLAPTAPFEASGQRIIDGLKQAASGDYETRAVKVEASGSEREAVTLAECPPGLFLWNGTLGFKSEYGAMEPADLGKTWTVGNRVDAYCADSGEYFWGGTSNHDDRAKVMVTPIEAYSIAPKDGINWKAEWEAVNAARIAEAALRPQPSGETREQAMSVARIEGWLKRNPRGGSEPIHPDDLRALLSARPLALGGQHSGGEVAFLLDRLADFENDINERDWHGHVAPAVARVKSALSTTPARAEAQDEGAAGERLLAFADDVAAMSVAIAVSNYTGALADDIRSVLARTHPSPPPAADADRVRAWDAFAANINWELSHGYPDGEEEDGCWMVHSANGGRNDREWTLIGRGETPLDAALAALKSEGK